MSKILEPLLPEGSILRVDENRNLLMLAGGEGEMRHALETVGVFDLDWLAGMSVGLFTLKSTDVKSIMPELELLFGDKSKTPFAGLLRVIPIERMNAVFIVSPRPQYLEQAKVWVDRLDRNGGKSGTRLYVYPVQNGNAEKIAALLSQVIGGKNASGTPAATVAPGLTGTSLQSSGGSTGGGLSGSTNAGSGTSTGGVSIGATPIANATPGVVASGTGEALGLGAGSTIKVIADRDNNSLLILANGAEYEKIEEAVKRLDVTPRQVLVEVTIAEVQLSGALTYGLEWFFNNGNNLSGRLVNAYGSAGTSALSSLNPADAVGAPLPFTAVWKTTGGNISAVLSALAKNTKVNVLSSPHVMVTDNQVAKINVGQSVPVEGQSTVVGTSILKSVVYVDTGVVLSVRPHINSGGLVTLEVSQEVSDVQVGLTTSTLNSPTINKRSAQTIVAVQSGDTMVLAGLIKDNKTAGSQGLPLLSEIPVVGALFGAKSDTSERSELIITITPRVVNDNQQARDVTAEFRKKLTGMQKLNPEAAGVVKSESGAAVQMEGVKGN
jgi:general secretion pathway protein D